MQDAGIKLCSKEAFTAAARSVGHEGRDGTQAQAPRPAQCEAYLELGLLGQSKQYTAIKLGETTG